MDKPSAKGNNQNQEGLVMIPAWRWPLVGFTVYGLAAVYYARMALMIPIAMIHTFLIWSAPLILISVLFFINWQIRIELAQYRQRID